MKFYVNDTIPITSSVENVLEMFDGVQQFYGKALRNSIIKLRKRKGKQVSSNLGYYNYLILDGEILEPIIEKYRYMDFGQNIAPGDRVKFKKSCVYSGKGINKRKYQHVVEGKKCMEKFSSSDLGDKFKRICRIWRKGHGIAVIQLSPETCEMEAFSREFALINAFGLENLTNEINGTCYGIMNDWNKNEINNFGNMLINRAMKSVLQDPPLFIYEKDVADPKVNSRRSKTWKELEIMGILKCFLEL